jgi:hypothetical protein
MPLMRGVPDTTLSDKEKSILEKLAVHKHLIKPTCCVNFNLALAYSPS